MLCGRCPNTAAPGGSAARQASVLSNTVRGVKFSYLRSLGCHCYVVGSPNGCSMKRLISKQNGGRITFAGELSSTKRERTGRVVLQKMKVYRSAPLNFFT